MQRRKEDKPHRHQIGLQKSFVSKNLRCDLYILSDYLYRRNLIIFEMNIDDWFLMPTFRLFITNLFVRFQLAIVSTAETQVAVGLWHRNGVDCIGIDGRFKRNIEDGVRDRSDSAFEIFNCYGETTK